MNIRKLYLDTSVIGGYFDDEFKEETQKLWKLMEQGRYKFHTSATTEKELIRAPERIKSLFRKTFDDEDVFIPSNEAFDLAEEYIKAGILSRKYTDDAVHVAVASLERLMILVSWNFKHMVNLRNKESFNAINLLNGYGNIRIVSPKELIYFDE